MPTRISYHRNYYGNNLEHGHVRGATVIHSNVEPLLLFHNCNIIRAPVFRIFSLNLNSVFIIQKCAVCFISVLKMRESCRSLFRNNGFLTVGICDPCSRMFTASS